MNHISIFLFVLPITLLLSFSSKASELSLLSVPKWPYGKQAALVLTLDDWSPGHGVIAAEYLNKKNIQATFFITTKNLWASGGTVQLLRMERAGHELSNHTHDHFSLATSNIERSIETIIRANKKLSSFIQSDLSESFAYPFGEYNTEVLDYVRNNFRQARIVHPPTRHQLHYNFIREDKNHHQIPTVRINGEYSQEKIDQYIDHVVDGEGLITFMVHSIFDNLVRDDWYDPMSAAQFRSLVNNIVNYSDQLWVTTLSEAMNYTRTRNNLSIHNITNNRNQAEFTLACLKAGECTRPVALCLQSHLAKNAHVYVNDKKVSPIFSDDCASFNGVSGDHIRITQSPSTQLQISRNFTF